MVIANVSVGIDIEKHKLENSSLIKEINSLKLEKKKREERLSCAMCGAGPFETIQALTGHKRKCEKCKN